MIKDVPGWIYTSVHIILYGMFFAGILMLSWVWIRRLHHIIAGRRRLPALQGRNQKLHEIHVHLEQLLITAGKGRCTAGCFVIICIMLFVWILLVGYWSGVGMMSAVLAFIGAFLPYVLLRIRLECIRQKGSMEGELLVSELLRQYRMAGCNIYEALEHTVSILERGSVSRMLCFQCLIRIRNTGNPVFIREASDLFYYGIHTNWSRMLATSIRLAAERGMNVTAAMDDIISQLKQARINYEERKRLNSEATRMTIYLIPVLYVFTVGLSVSYMGIGFRHLLRNQFGTPEGIVFFFIGAAMFVFNIMAVEMMNNRRFDC